MLPKPKSIVDEKVLEAARRKGCILCGRYAFAHHIHTKGAHRLDYDWNVIGLCGLHHDEWHHSFVKFFAVHPHARFEVERLGWEITDRLWHPRLADIWKVESEPL